MSAALAIAEAVVKLVGKTVRPASLQIIDDHERLHSLIKADLREYTIAKTSPMPSYRGMLSDAEMADVLAYLLSLKGR